MMGGFGSGRRSGSGRDTVEMCRSIDVNRLHKAGCLRSGYWGSWQWTGDGERVHSINAHADVDQLHLSYRGASAAASGRTWLRQSASSTRPAGSAALGPTSSALAL